jgi:hypothetical protein
VTLRSVVAGLVLTALGVILLALSHDLRGWDRALAEGDGGFERRPAGARWSASSWLPGDPVRDALAVDDDLRLRRAVQAYAIAAGMTPGLDNGARQARTRAAAEIALADVTASGSSTQASQAGNLLGVLVATADRAPDAAATEDRAGETFGTAIRADPENADAKYNLELILRRIRVVGVREGPANAAGNRGDSRRGAGSGAPGSGY